MADRDLAGRLEAARSHAADAARATDAVAADASLLTDAIRAVTARTTEQGTAIATRLAEGAFATQRSVTSIGDSATSLVKVAETVGAALRKAEIVGLNASIEAARAGEGAWARVRGGGDGDQIAGASGRDDAGRDDSGGGGFAAADGAGVALGARRFARRWRRSMS